MTDHSVWSSDHDYIHAILLDEVRAHMIKGAAHYGPDNHNEMGLKGQFADMYRKFRPLKRYLWDEVPHTLGKENPREICMDLIGHCLLTIAMIDRKHSSQPIITGPTTGEDADKLRAAGWTEKGGAWEVPKERGPEFRRVSVLTDQLGIRRCSECTAIVGPGNTCNCAPS